MGQGDGEWNQVTRKRGRNKPAIEQSKSEGLLGGIRPNPNPELTVAEIRKYHESVDQEWRSSGCWEKLQKALLEGCAARDAPLLTSAICLGPGPFDPANGSLLVRRTAHMQTAAFASIVANLGRAFGCCPSPLGPSRIILTVRWRGAKRTKHQADHPGAGIYSVR